jgi:fido (protein-threonine AMPylation protein)
MKKSLNEQKQINQPTDEEVNTFLSESNKIEREYGQEALDDAKQAWIMGALCFKDFDVSYILGIHRRLLKRLAPHYAGIIRTSAVYIGGDIRNQSKEEILLQLNELVDIWNKNKEILKTKSKKDKEDFVKKWHILYELCHPNFDGNGRTGRILMNLQRLYIGLPLLIIYTGIQQQNYYTWFHKKASRLGISKNKKGKEKREQKREK